jgi:hypothetical protein
MMKRISQKIVREDRGFGEDEAVNFNNIWCKAFEKVDLHCFFIQAQTHVSQPFFLFSAQILSNEFIGWSY